MNGKLWSSGVVACSESCGFLAMHVHISVVVAFRCRAVPSIH